MVNNFTNLKMVIIARWNHRGLKNCYSYVVSYKNNSGRFVRKITFCRKTISSPTNFYLTIGHEISHTVVAERNQNQKLGNGWYFDLGWSIHPYFDRKKEFYNLRRQQDVMDQFIFFWMVRRFQKMYHLLDQRSKCRNNKRNHIWH